MAQQGAQSIPKQKLSSMLDSNTATAKFVDHLIQTHHVNTQRYPQHAVVIGNGTQSLWNALLFYVDGGNVTLAKGLNETPEKFEIPYNLIEEMLDSFLEVDMPESELLKKLRPAHPYMLLKEVIALKALSEKGQLDNERVDYLKEHLRMFLMEVNGKISNKDKSLTIFNAELKKVNPQEIILTNEGGIDIPLKADLLIRVKGNMVNVQTFDAPSLLNQKTQAHAMHETMVKAAKYHERLETSIKDFVDKPNKEADALFAKVSRQRPNIPDVMRPQVSVVGLGPAGAFAAIRAYQEGAIVTGIEKRTGYSRNNVFRLTPKVVEELAKLFVDKLEDIKDLPDSHPLKTIVNIKSLTAKTPSPLGDFYAISIKDFEYLTNAWIDLMSKKDPKGMQIFRGYVYIPQCIDKDERAIFIRESDAPVEKGKEADILGTDRQVPTQILVAADGYNSQCRRDCKIEVEKMSTNAPYATFTYHPPRGDENDFFSSMLKGHPRKEIPMEKLRALGWDKNRQPVPRYFNTGDHPYLGIEMPDNIAVEYQQLSKLIMDAKQQNSYEQVQKLSAQRDALFDAWGRLTLGMFLSQDQINKLVLKECALINVELMKAKKFTFMVPMSKIAAILIGDCAQSAHFQTGRGAIVGIEEADDVGRLVKNLVRGGTTLENEMAHYEKFSQRKALTLEELAFHFPTKEDLRVQKTPAFHTFREDTRVGILTDDHKAVKPETAKEAQTKATSMATKKNY